MKTIYNLNEPIRDFKEEDVPDGELRIEVCDECKCKRIKMMDTITIKEALVQMLNATAQPKAKDAFRAGRIARAIFSADVRMNEDGAERNGDAPAEPAYGTVELENADYDLLKRVVKQNSFGNNGRYLPCVIVPLLGALGLTEDTVGEE